MAILLAETFIPLGASLQCGCLGQKTWVPMPHQQAADDLGGNLFGGAGEEGLGEVLGKRGGLGDGLDYAQSSSVVVHLPPQPALLTICASQQFRSAHAAFQLMQHSIRQSSALAAAAALALASIPIGAAKAEGTKVAQAPATAKDLGVMDINLKDAVKFNYGFQGALQGAGTPNQGLLKNPDRLQRSLFQR